MSSIRTPVRALTIAGSDSGGGAGIQADLKTFQAVGCYGMSVVTVLTAQNTQGVQSIFPTSPEFVMEQIESVLGDIGVDAIKIGMLYSEPIIEAVACCLSKHRPLKIVVDPVMIAKGGSRLLVPDAVDALKRLILPLASLVTPNLPEAEVLTGITIDSRTSMEHAMEKLLELCSGAVLKGGHLTHSDDSSDLFAMRTGEREWFGFPRIVTRNTHGTGCTYSAAIAGYAAHGLDWKQSVDQARKYVQGAIQSGSNFVIGHGHGPVDHGWALRIH